MSEIPLDQAQTQTERADEAQAQLRRDYTAVIEKWDQRKNQSRFGPCAVCGAEINATLRANGEWAKSVPCGHRPEADLLLAALKAQIDGNGARPHEDAKPAQDPTRSRMGRQGASPAPVRPPVRRQRMTDQKIPATIFSGECPRKTWTRSKACWGPFCLRTRRSGALVG